MINGSEKVQKTNKNTFFLFYPDMWHPKYKSFL